MSKKKAPAGPKRVAMKQSNVRYPVDLLARAKAAAKWEEENFSEYMRAAVLRRVQTTEAAITRADANEG